MLADIPNASAPSGIFSKDLHLPATSLSALLSFITDELPRWRDRPERKKETAETVLTSQLCAHLNSAARRSEGWDFLQFRIEEPDEQVKSRKIDLVPAPCGAAVWIEGRRHIDFDPLLPIECKRLPTPNDKDRDEREYVISGQTSTGGIQRFKAGHHGAGHKIGAIIGYIQQETRMFWKARVAEWIKGLVDAGQAGWNVTDQLKDEHDDDTLQLTVLRSAHTREKGLPDIELRHLWVQMN
jgi:hypothetical protein